MKNALRSAAVAACLLVSTGPCLAEAPASEASVRELLDITDADKASAQMVAMLIPEMKKMVPDVPGQFWLDFVAEIKSEELLDLYIPIYRKHFTEREVRAAIAFYSSPEGQAFIRKQPVIIQESTTIGMAWGRTLAERVLERAQNYERASQ